MSRRKITPIKKRQRLVCLACGHIKAYESREVLCSRCRGMHMIPIDVELIDAILTLNEKGHYTSFCCAGHVGANGFNDDLARGYIAFEGLLPASAIRMLWDRAMDNRKDHGNKRDVIRWEGKAEEMPALLTRVTDWANGLDEQE